MDFFCYWNGQIKEIAEKDQLDKQDKQDKLEQKNKNFFELISGILPGRERHKNPMDIFKWLELTFEIIFVILKFSFLLLSLLLLMG